MPPPIPEPAAVAIFAGDHGVAAAGVSAYRPEDTARLVELVLRGGAAVSVLAEAAGATDLHHDANFDRTAEITGEPTEWVTPSNGQAHDPSDQAGRP